MLIRLRHLVLFAAALLCAQAEDAPVVVSGELSVDGSATLRGGARRSGSAHGLALVGADWERAAEGAATTWRAHASVLGLAGKGPTEHHVGDLLAVSNTEGHESLRLYSTWVEAEAGAWSLRAGLLLADEEFGGTDSGGALLNSSFGWPAFISANTVNTGPAFFVPAWGLRARATLSEKTSFQFGVYDGDSFDSADGDPVVNEHGLRNRLSNSQGAFLIAELSRSLPERTRLKAGAWMHTADFADVRRDAAGQSFTLAGTDPRLHNGNYGGYVSLEHSMGAAAEQPGAIDLHVRAGVAPEDRNALGWAVDAAVSWLGPIPGRPQDRLTFGFAHAHHSDEFRRAALDADPAAPSPDFEQILELAYCVQLHERFSVQPDFQLVRHPGGSPVLDDAIVFLVRARLTF